MEDDFLLDEEDDDLNLISPEEEDDEGDSEEEEEVEITEKVPVKTTKDYGGRLTKDEITLISAYDDISLSSKKNKDRVSIGGGSLFDGNILDAVRTIVSMNPKNTSLKTVEDITKEMFHRQGHNRIPASVYAPDKPLRSDDLEDEFGGSDDGGFNEAYRKEFRDQIARFIKYLTDRDLSKDAAVSRKRKLRQLPAFLIFLFSSGMYDLVLNCETLPPEYKDQVDRAFKRIQKQKYDIVEALAEKYESVGRDKVAERVRKMGLDWFLREPAEIRTLASYRDLGITQDDVMIYREFRPRFINASKSITQELISDMIEVVIQPGKIYEKLKDKTRSDAIADVKQVYKDWAKDNPMDSELADKIIWKDI